MSAFTSSSFTSAPDVGRALNDRLAADTGTLKLLTRAERLTLGAQLTLAMISGGLLIIALLWRFFVPDGRPVADLISAIAAVLVAIPVVIAAVQSLRHPSLHGVTDQLVAVAMLGCWATGELLTAALLPIVMIAGHVLEERSLLGSREAIRALGRLVDSTTLRLLPDGTTEEVTVSQIRPGDKIELRVGDRALADGVIIKGHSALDTASLTGESVPVEVHPGDAALAGSINTSGVLVVEVTRVGSETTLGQIISLMEVAEEAKPPLTRLLEQYAAPYMALVMTVAVIVWFATGSAAAMLAVLVASCPCAVVLAAPATSIAAIAVAARHGILIKGAAFLEQLAEVSSLVIDKTGTLTTGALSLAGMVPAEGVEPAHLMRVAASLGSVSHHPVSRALAGQITEKDILPLDDIHEEHGLGMRAQLAGGDIQAVMGRAALLRSLGTEPGEAPRHDGPIVGVSEGGRFLGWIMLADRPRPEARDAVTQLRDLGLARQVMLTGDRLVVAQGVAAETGIDTVRADVLPRGKMECVLAEINAGYRPLVVGDGINDALALKAGAVGIAMGAQGTDVALGSADLVLMTSDLRRLPTAIRLSRRCRQTIQVNVGMGVGWTVVLIGLASAGVLGAQGAIVAAVLHNLSTLAGLANAGRLLRFDETRHAA